MTENENEQRQNVVLDTLRDEIKETVMAFAEKVSEKLGPNLQSITLVGSSLTSDFKQGYSDINTVIVLEKQALEYLNILAGMAKAMNKKKIAMPLLMTTDYIERSRDVFGIEFLSFQLIHETILGPDPFCQLNFAKSDVRLQCERELKATLIRLRQGYIASAANKKLVRDILISAVSGLVPLLSAVLWLKDIERPRESQAVLVKALGELSIKSDRLCEVLGWRHQKLKLSQIEIQGAFKAVYTAIEELSVIVDKLEV